MNHKTEDARSDQRVLSEILRVPVRTTAYKEQKVEEKRKGWLQAHSLSLYEH